MGGWQSEDASLRWPWLVVALAALVVVLLVWWALARRGRPPVGASYVAHATRLSSLPRYRALVQQRRVLGMLLSIAALITVAGTLVLAGRVQERQTLDQNDRTRDIMLCLDASGSMAEVDADVLREFRTIVDGLQGERIGLTIWSGVAITIFPLTDDYDYVVDQLTEAEAAFASGDVYSDDYALYTAGTVIDWDVQSQMGDGLASCVQRFDRREEDRSRAIVLASDNEPLGRGIFTVDEAADFAAGEDVIVHGIAAPLTAERPGALRQFEQATATTGGTFALLGEDGSTSAVVEAIGALEAKQIERPPLAQVLDRPTAGTILTGLGVLALALVWFAEFVTTRASARASTRSSGGRRRSS